MTLKEDQEYKTLLLTQNKYINMFPIQKYVLTIKQQNIIEEASKPQPDQQMVELRDALTDFEPELLAANNNQLVTIQDASIEVFDNAMNTWRTKGATENARFYLLSDFSYKIFHAGQSELAKGHKTLGPTVKDLTTNKADKTELTKQEQSLRSTITQEVNSLKTHVVAELKNATDDLQAKINSLSTSISELSAAPAPKAVTATLTGSDASAPKDVTATLTGSDASAPKDVAATLTSGDVPGPNATFTGSNTQQLTAFDVDWGTLSLE